MTRSRLALYFLAGTMVASLGIGTFYHFHKGIFPMTNIANFVSSQNAIRSTNNVNLLFADDSGSGFGQSGAVTSVKEVTIGWQAGATTLPTVKAGSTAPLYNALVLDGTHATTGYQFSVDATGTLTITDESTGGGTSGQTMTVTGLSYILFNDGTTNAAGYVGSDMMIVASGNNAEIARFYQSTYGRIPDLPGYEAWNQAVANGVVTIHQAAADFITSNEFNANYGNQAGMTDQQFVSQMYANVLGRPADQGGLNAWTAYLTGLEMQNGNTAAGNIDARASILEHFATSTEEILHSSSWLIDTGNGGYADAATPLSAATVLNQGTADGYINTALMATSTLTPTTPVYSSDAVKDARGDITAGSMVTGDNTIAGITTFENNVTIILSTQVPVATIYGHGDTINGSTRNNGSINLSYSDNVMNIGSGQTVVTTAYHQLTNGTAATVTGFKAGADLLQDSYSDAIYSGQTQTVTHATVTVLDGSVGATFNGAALTFNSTWWTTTSGPASLKPDYVINVGNVGGGTAAEVATALDKVYTAAGTAAEHFTIIGQVTASSSVGPAGDTVVYGYGTFGSTSYASTGVAPGGAISASQIWLEAKLVGVTTTSLTHVDFGSGQ